MTSKQYEPLTVEGVATVKVMLDEGVYEKHKANLIGQLVATIAMNWSLVEKLKGALRKVALGAVDEDGRPCWCLSAGPPSEGHKEYCDYAAAILRSTESSHLSPPTA